jgi:tetratricopeptide (TPR) repeat protein
MKVGLAATMIASLSLIFLLWALPVPGQAQSQEAATYQNDLAAMRILLDEISSDPNNRRTRSLLRDLWQENLRKRETDLEQELKVSASTEAQKQLTQALEALRSTKQEQASGGTNSDADIFSALVRSAAGSYEQGRQEEAFLVLSTAFSLYPAWTGALPSSGQPSKDQLSQNIRSVKISKKTSTHPLSAGATYSQVVTPKDAEAARQFFRSGVRFYSAGKFAQAAQSFREGLARDPNNEWITKSLARSLAELKVKAQNAPSRPVPQPPVIPAPATASPSPGSGARQPLAATATGTIEHEVRAGDTLRKLATQYYGNPAYWDIIWKANRGIKDKNVLKAGDTLVIPPLPKKPTRH